MIIEFLCIWKIIAFNESTEIVFIQNNEKLSLLYYYKRTRNEFSKTTEKFWYLILLKYSMIILSLENKIILWKMPWISDWLTEITYLESNWAIKISVEGEKQQNWLTFFFIENILEFLVILTEAILMIINYFEFSTFSLKTNVLIVFFIFGGGTWFL